MSRINPRIWVLIRHRPGDTTACEYFAPVTLHYGEWLSVCNADCMMALTEFNYYYNGVTTPGDTLYAGNDGTKWIICFDIRPMITEVGS